MKNLLNIGLLFAMSMATVVFTSCKKEKEKEDAVLELFTVNGMGTGNSSLGSYLDLDALLVYGQADITASAHVLNSLDLLFGGGTNAKIADPVYGATLSGIDGSVAADYNGGAVLYNAKTGAWENSETVSDIATYLGDPVEAAVTPSRNDVYIVYTTEGNYVLIRVNDITTGTSPTLSLKAKKAS